MIHRNPLVAFTDEVRAILGDDGLAHYADDALRLGIDLRDCMDDGDEPADVALAILRGIDDELTGGGE